MSILPDELFVSGIAADATEEQVTAAFGEHGEVREYVVVSKERSGGATQCALVRMTDHHGAMAAKKAMHRSELMGRTLNVRWSNTQRVIWAGNLHESVTNEVLKVAFAQFGTVQRAVVVVDAQTLATKCYGFVVFDNKKDAKTAMQRCSEQPFLIGSSGKPVKVTWARLDDTDTGYTEEMRIGPRKGAAAVPVDLTAANLSRFAAGGSREYVVAVRVAELEVEYTQMKSYLRQKMGELQAAALMSGHAPPLSSTLHGSSLFAGAGAPPPGPAGPPPSYGTMPPPGHGYAPPAYNSVPPPGSKRPDAGENFHHVPPPKRSNMRPKSGDYERFNPEAVHLAHHQGGPPPPAGHPGYAAPPRGGPPPPAAPPPAALSFVRSQTPVHMQKQPVTVVGPKGSAGGPATSPPPAGAGDKAGADAAAASELVGAQGGTKMPGMRNAVGIGFAGDPAEAARESAAAAALAHAQASLAAAQRQAAQANVYVMQPRPPPPQYAPQPQQQQQPPQYATQQYATQQPPPQYAPPQYAPPPQQQQPPPQYATPPPQYATPPPQYATQPPAPQPQYSAPPPAQAPPPQQPQQYAPQGGWYAPPPQQAAAPQQQQQPQYAPQQAPQQPPAQQQQQPAAYPPPADGPPQMSGYAPPAAAQPQPYQGQQYAAW